MILANHICVYVVLANDTTTVTGHAGGSYALLLLSIITYSLLFCWDAALPYNYKSCKLWHWHPYSEQL